MARGFKKIDAKDTIKVKNFKRWDSTEKQFNVEKTPTYFAEDTSTGLYQECVGTIVDDNDKVLGAIIFVNEDRTPKAE